VSYVCPAVTCRQTKCFKHCNHCGKDVVWRPPLLDREIAYAGPKPLNPNGSVHRCMLQGTRDGRYYKTDPVSIKNYYRVPGYSPEQVEKMKDPTILAAWQKGVKDWIDKWEKK
jgi:hypothetical protein